MNTPDETLSCGIAEACQRLGVGRTMIFDMIQRREIKSFRIGRRRLIPVSELQRVVRERMEQEARA